MYPNTMWNNSCSLVHLVPEVGLAPFVVAHRGQQVVKIRTGSSSRSAVSALRSVFGSGMAHLDPVGTSVMFMMRRFVGALDDYLAGCLRGTATRCKNQARPKSAVAAGPRFALRLMRCQRSRTRRS